MRHIRYIDAIREAQWEEMRRDETVFIFGEGVGPRGGCFTQTKGMWPDFGERRLIDTPLSEMGFTGVAIGAALTGLRPVVDLMFWDFAYEAIGQIINQAGRIHYLSNGQFKVPLVVRGAIGVGQSAGGHHSSRSYPLYVQMPGLKVVVPSTPYDAKGLLKTAIRDDGPVLVFEHKALFNTTGPVPEEDYAVPFGQHNTDQDDRDHFHDTWRAACEAHPEVADYDEFEDWCDRYFYLPHRQERRGVGGIFFDYLWVLDDDGELDVDRAEKVFAFVRDCGEAFLRAYVPVAERHLDEPVTEAQRRWHEQRRGRYVEFNLVYDRGTVFGLKTGGRTESILMSLPPRVRWDYAARPEPGSAEAQLLAYLQRAPLPEREPSPSS